MTIRKNKRNELAFRKGVMNLVEDFFTEMKEDHWSQKPDESIEEDESGDVFNELMDEFCAWWRRR